MFFYATSLRCGGDERTPGYCRRRRPDGNWRAHGAVRASEVSVALGEM